MGAVFKYIMRKKGKGGKNFYKLERRVKQRGRKKERSQLFNGGGMEGKEG